MENKKIIVDVAAGTIELKNFTKKEAEEFAAIKEQGLAEVEARKAEAEAKQAARQSAIEKLAALGLTEAEIQALAG